MFLLLFPIFMGQFACGTDPEVEWVRFNAEDMVSIEVTEGSELGLAVDGELRSTTGATALGTIVVEPGSGPVGTDHVLSVLVDDEYEETVDRVTVYADAGERGEDEYELRQDSAEHGLWVVTLTSMGETGEVRTDSFEIALWETTETNEE
jgi:hypothetical protein